MSASADSARGLVGRITGRGSPCVHLAEVRDVEPGTVGCEECLASGGKWVHLRLCLSCGHVGCCDASEGRHAFHHYEDSSHPLIRSHEPGEDWRWCWVDQVQL